MDPTTIIGVFGILAVVGFFSVIAALLIAKNLMYVCPPNKVLIFSGGLHRLGDRTVGYRYIKGGRALRIPMLETVDEIDLTNMIIEVSVVGAYSKGGIPLTVQGVANVKVASHEPLLANALERFLRADRQHIMKVAKDTLEGNLRGVLAQLTPEQVNEDKIAFAEKLLEEAEQDLGKLGLVLDTLKIQNVSDDVKYLDSIGRKQSAEVVKTAKIAEAEAKATSAIRDATNRQSARIAEIEAEQQVVGAKTERRIADAMTKREAMIAEEVGKVKAAIAKAEAELKAQQARVEQVRRQLQADIVAPAQAEMEADIAAAKGSSRKIVEDGRATAAVLQQMIATWKKGGAAARDIFLMQKLEKVLKELMGTVQGIEVERITMLPGGSDSRATKAVTLVEELKAAVGIDIPRALGQISAKPQTK
jgi:flotillin